MIISHKYKCIFIRVPKTGSTSIESMWKAIDPDCEISDIYNPPYGHFKCSELKRVLGDKIWNSYFKFAFVREPKSWFKSQYTDNMKYQHELNSSIHILLNNDYMLHNPEDRTFKLDDCINMYVFLNKLYEGTSMTSYLDLEIDYIGLMENLNQDLMHIMQKLGCDLNVIIPHYNKSESKKYSFDKESEIFLELILKKDIELYNKIKNDF